METISVVVPACNEESVIGRCLTHMIRGALPGELDIVVVCNGCCDGTARIARSFPPFVRVAEIRQASKHIALNVGDHIARAFPRFYVDADVVLSIRDLRAVAATIRAGRAHAAAPRLRVDLRDRPWTIRAFYAVWLRTHYVNGRMVGSGVYALSEEGRRRFGRFPDLIADDCFVQALFQPDERARVDEASFVITPPRDLRHLVHVNIRRYLGVREIAARFPDLKWVDRGLQRRSLMRIAREPLLFPALGIYVSTRGLIALASLWQALRGQRRSWNRDESSRRAA